MSEEEKGLFDTLTRRTNAVLQIGVVCITVLFSSIGWAVKQDNENVQQNRQIAEIRQELGDLEKQLDSLNINTVTLAESVKGLTKAIDKLETRKQ
jgi:peptidoglycan hydrolase CwlO-like protein